jgi:hypothetical protein
VSPISIVAAVIVGAVSVFSTLQQQKDARREADGYECRKAILNVKVDATVTPIDENKSAVVVDVLLTNDGKQTIYPYAHADDKNGTQTHDGEGCTISITRYAVDAPGRIKDSGDRVVKRHNILDRYDFDGPGSWQRLYELKPDTHYRETEAFVLENGWLYEIVARFYACQDGGKWTNEETKFLYLRPPSKSPNKAANGETRVP